MPIQTPINSTNRIFFINTAVSILGWPSLGGVIILDEATHVDFTFLGLSTTDPPLKRPSHSTIRNYEEAVAKEDKFCQRLLLLGAKWWDSPSRYHLISVYQAEDPNAVAGVEAKSMPERTVRESKWVRVAWDVSSGNDYDTLMKTVSGS